jgi:hypothetical protein
MTGTMVSMLWLVSCLTLGALVQLLGFLFLGALRLVGILRRQLEQLQATTPSRLVPLLAPRQHLG